MQDKSIMVTGGTGSWGHQFIKTALGYNPKRLIIFSRDELKQHQMRQDGFTQPCLRYFIGDVRDYRRLYRAMEAVDIVIHAAALKQVPSCEYNPDEVVKTNVLGTQNVIDAAIDRQVGKVILLSSDKCVSPINLYGASKLCAEKLFVQGNAYARHVKTRFSVVRYGNVMGSRGSVIPVFQEQKRKGETLTITDQHMTRFWITLDQAVRFVLRCLEIMAGGEVFVPKIPSMKITDLAEAIYPGATWKIVGIRPGEKLHEVLVSEEESQHTVEQEGMYIIKPNHPWWDNNIKGEPMKGGAYTSDTNSAWLTVEELREIVGG